VDINCSLSQVSCKMVFIMKSIQQQVSIKWNEQRGRISANSFFFLRFLSPYLVSPPASVGKSL
jgi:hypothetical protein